MPPKPSTVGELKKSGYKPCSIKEELRRNLLVKLKNNQPLFPGIIGYDKTVIPQVINALLSKHDFILLGLRGQAKTRLARQLTALLDAEIPVLVGFPMATPGKVFPRRELLAHLQGPLATGSTRTVDVHIHNLRAKIEPDPARPRYIVLDYGIGYRLAEGGAAAPASPAPGAAP